MKACLKNVPRSLLVIVTSIFFIQCSDNMAERKLREVADEINKSCPIKIDDITTLDSCQVLPNRTFRYNYTMVFDEIFSDQEKATIDLYQKSQQTAYLQQNPKQLKALIDINTTFQHAYYNVDGHEFAVINFTPDQYKRKPDMQSEEYVYNEIEDIAKAFRASLPLEYSEGMKILRINTVFPKTIIYDVENSNIEKSDSFDSIQYKEQRKLLLIYALRKNVFSALLKDAGILYQCRYFDKNQQYLCTIDIFPEDFK